MELNTRSQQIAKSSVYFMLTKMAQNEELKKASVEAKKTMPKTIDLGIIIISVENGRIEVLGSRYPANRITLLTRDKRTNIWTTEGADTAQAIGEIISEIAKRQIYPGLKNIDAEKIIFSIAREVWSKIDSWAH